MLREADGICVPPGVGQAEGPGGAACCQPASRSHSVFLEAEFLKIALVYVKVCLVENVISWKSM